MTFYPIISVIKAIIIIPKRNKTKGKNAKLIWFNVLNGVIKT